MGHIILCLYKLKLEVKYDKNIIVEEMGTSVSLLQASR